ncbi:MAG: helicase-related protein [Thermomicrobiales bacterium]
MATRFDQASYEIGSLVRARDREWVVLPSDDAAVVMLRPLGGTDADACGIIRAAEPIEPATFAPPDPAMLGDSTSARLLRDAVRLAFRAGAGPFRSFGRIAVEPRPYQLIPLMMALRLDPVRLLIADDVGIGKTIEAALIARELLDRGEINRLAVICPPHLCDQWQAELASKFHIEAVVVRPGTVTRLERPLSLDQSVFDAYPFVVVSVDYIKADRRRADFVRACPEFVIVDEAHTCAAAATASGAQHQRHQLVRDLARDETRHLMLATATPHSGVESAFRSLLELLDPVFADLPEDQQLSADHPLRQRLANHLVQRRRADIRAYLDDETTFPVRATREETYRMSAEYAAFFDQVRDYAVGLIRGAEGQTRFRQRVCWWAALALLRCVSSSPAAAELTLRTRAGGVDLDDAATTDVALLDELGERAVLDLDASDAVDGDDVVPGADTVDADDDARDRRKLHELARQAARLTGAKDNKLLLAVETTRRLVDDEFRPVVYCRYIATAEYVAAELAKRLKGVEVAAVTGRLPAEERAVRVEALAAFERRVLVATDCLSEGINLQEHFDAVVHYDLSWNPTRHEQREGRVDRFRQHAPEVRAVLFYGEDNPIDGAIMRVLLRKAEAIRKRLGITVPVPVEIATVMEAVFDAIFHGRGDSRQLTLGLDGGSARADEALQEIDVQWERAEERESRTIFAQRAIYPEQVRRELTETQRALGDARDVARLTRDAAHRLGTPLGNGKHPTLAVQGFPVVLRSRLGLDKATRVGFELPLPEGVLHLSRTHPTTEALCGYLLDTALDPGLMPPGQPPPAARCGAIRTDAVARRTTLALLRLRVHLDVTRPDGTRVLLAEECVTAAWRRRGAEAEWLDPAEADALLDAAPRGHAEVGQRQLWVSQALDDYQSQGAAIAALAERRAGEVHDAHRRVRAAAGVRAREHQVAVRPILPADLLGIYVFMPAAPG